MTTWRISSIDAPESIRSSTSAAERSTVSSPSGVAFDPDGLTFVAPESTAAMAVATACTGSVNQPESDARRMSRRVNQPEICLVERLG